jgi:hypothetical protein
MAYAKEHAIVHVVGQYCKKIDADLRNKLGGEAYGEWEKLADGEMIP